MKISNNLITSIACYRKHFEFHAVWSQLKVFLRDMSPQDVPYPDSTSELLYNIIKDPAMVTVANDQFQVKGTADNPFSLNNVASLDLQAIKKEAPEDRIRILALFELAGQVIKEEYFENEAFNLDGAKELILSNGHSLKVVEQDYVGQDLILRQIKVDAKTFCSSVVDGVEIQPGKFAYGVFSKLGLHKVLSPMAQNEEYRLRLSINASGTIETLVHNKLDGTQSHMPNVKSFCIIGKDNYAYVDNEMVYCHHNEILAKRIKDVVGFLDSPLFIQLDDNKIVVTMKDGNVKYVNLK